MHELYIWAEFGFRTEIPTLRQRHFGLGLGLGYRSLHAFAVPLGTNPRGPRGSHVMGWIELWNVTCTVYTMSFSRNQGIRMLGKRSIASVFVESVLLDGLDPSAADNAVRLEMDPGLDPTLHRKYPSVNSQR